MPGGFGNIAALLSGPEITPEMRTKLRHLTRGPEAGAEAVAAAPASAELALDPIFGGGEQSFSLKGNPAGGASSAVGSALLAPQEATSPAPDPTTPAPRQLRRFDETAGGKTALALLEKRKRLKWWMPEQFANRNDRDLSQALELARLEMGGEETQERTAQGWAQIEQNRLRHDSDTQRWTNEDEDRDASRGLAERSLEHQIEADMKRFAMGEAEIDLRRGDQKLRGGELEERRQGRISGERMTNRARSDARTSDFMRIALGMAGGGAGRAGGEPWQKPYASWLESTEGTYADEAQREAMKKEYQKLFGGGGAPFPGAAPGQAPPAAPPASSGIKVNPKTGERIMWNGQAWVPVRTPSP